jgi:hypothetical protein
VGRQHSGGEHRGDLLIPFHHDFFLARGRTVDAPDDALASSDDPTLEQ